MNPNGIFWLARYAHNVIAPLVKADEYLQIVTTFTGVTEGVDIWVHRQADGKVAGYKTGIKAKEAVDAFAATLQTQEAPKLPGLTRGDAPAFA